MKSPLLNLICGVCILAALAIPVCVVAQGEQQQPAGHVQHYTVTDLGTLEGGTFSQPFFINRYGLETSTPDPNGEDFCGFGTHLTGTRGMAQLGGTPSVAGSRWLGTDLPEFTTGSRAKHKNQLTATVAKDIEKETI